MKNEKRPIKPDRKPNVEDKENKDFRDFSDVMVKPLEIISMENVSTDPNGSWTGVPLNPYEKPVQDADDL